MRLRYLSFLDFSFRYYFFFWLCLFFYFRPLLYLYIFSWWRYDFCNFLDIFLVDRCRWYILYFWFLFGLVLIDLRWILIKWRSFYFISWRNFSFFHINLFSLFQTRFMGLFYWFILFFTVFVLMIGFDIFFRSILFSLRNWRFLRDLNLFYSFIYFFVNIFYKSINLLKFFVFLFIRYFLCRCCLDSVFKFVTGVDC